MRHIAVNWHSFGVWFVLGMLAMVAGAGWVTNKLREWAERPEPVKHELPFQIKLDSDFLRLIKENSKLRAICSANLMPTLPQREYIPSPPRKGWVMFTSRPLPWVPVRIEAPEMPWQPFSPAEIEAIARMPRRKG